MNATVTGLPSAEQYAAAAGLVMTRAAACLLAVTTCSQENLCMRWQDQAEQDVAAAKQYRVAASQLFCCRRLGNDQGRSVSAWGFWGDMLNSPYHCFGTACKERSFFKLSNKQFMHTAVSVSEYNVTV